MVNWTRYIPYLVVSVGIYQIVTGIFLINWRVGYIPVIQKTGYEYGNVFTFLIVVYSIFLLLIYRGLRKKTWTSWYFTVIFLIFYFISSIFRIPKILPIEFLALVLNGFSLVILFKYRKNYVFPPMIKLPRETLASLGIIIFSVLYGVTGTLILGNQFSPPVKNIDDAIYYTIEVMTTLGFGDILPVTEMSRLFTSSLVVLGVASFFGAVATFFGPIIQNRIEKVVNFMETAEFTGFRDHIIFCGYTPLISSLIRELKRNEIPFVLLVRDQENATFLRNDGYIVLRERADNPEALIKVGIKRARKVYISSSDDGYNLMVALTINKLKKEYNLKIKIAILLNSSANMEMVRDFVDEIIDISDIVKDKIISNI
ncbi:MAG: NAD-binding protein [Thermoplasmata archaeon]